MKIYVNMPTKIEKGRMCNVLDNARMKSKTEVKTDLISRFSSVSDYSDIVATMKILLMLDHDITKNIHSNAFFLPSLKIACHSWHFFT